MTSSQERLVVLACHTYGDVKVMLTLNNIEKLAVLAKNIVIVESEEFAGILEHRLRLVDNYIVNNTLSDAHLEKYQKNNHDLKTLNKYELQQHWARFGRAGGRKIDDGVVLIDITYTRNDSFLCEGKWYRELLKLDPTRYSDIILTNDSFFLLRDIPDFENLFDENIELTALLSSNQIKFHYPDFLRRYSAKGLVKLRNYMAEQFQKFSSLPVEVEELIDIFEIHSSFIFDTVNVLYPAEPEYCGNVHFDDEKIQTMVIKGDYPILKLKKVNRHIYGDRQWVPADFAFQTYLSLNPDLSADLNEEQCLLHFLNYGKREGRMYKREQIPNNKLFAHFFGRSRRPPQPLSQPQSEPHVQHPFRRPNPTAII